MKKRLSIFGILFAVVALEIPLDGFASSINNRRLSFAPGEGTQVIVSVNQPRRHRRRRTFRNGRRGWISYAPNRRYRMARRYYYVGGMRRSRMVRVYY